MTYMVGGRVMRLGSFPGREGEGLGLFLEDGSAARVVRIVYLPGVDAAAREGLEREVSRAADALHHPHVEPPLGLGEVDGRLAVAVEYADGETLAEILAVGGRLPPEVAARIVRDACSPWTSPIRRGRTGTPSCTDGCAPPTCSSVAPGSRWSPGSASVLPARRRT